MKKAAFLVLILLVTSMVFALDSGDKAADFTMQSADGKQVKLSDYNGKNVIVIFVSTKCPYSNAFNDVMAKLATDYASKGVVVLGVNSNKSESMEDVAKHSKDHFSFPVLKDPENKVANTYGAKVTPEAYLIDGSGVIVYHGALGSSSNPTTDPKQANSDEIRAALGQLLGGKAVVKAKTKAFGCTIKRV